MLLSALDDTSIQIFYYLIIEQCFREKSLFDLYAVLRNLFFTFKE